MDFNRTKFFFYHYLKASFLAIFYEKSPTNTVGALIQSAYSHHLHPPQVVPTYGY